MFAVPAAVLAFLLVWLDDDLIPALLDDVGISGLMGTQLWAAATAMIGILLSFRTNRAMARFWEGTGLLHQMRGEWFDSVSCCVTFSRSAIETKPEIVKEFRHTIVRLMSLCHSSALEEIAGENGETLETIDVFGLDDATLLHLRDCKEIHQFNRVEVLLHLIQSLITKSLDDKVLNIPPPILSRVYQTLSRGFVNLLNAKKIADTRFPFPYAQLISVLLLTHCILTPVMLAALIRSPIWCAIFSFLPIFGMFYLNFVGVELENPFGDDDNDLPLDHFQTEMNTCLLMLLQENADLIPSCSRSRCLWKFGELKLHMRPYDKSFRPGFGKSLRGSTRCRVKVSSFDPSMMDDQDMAEEVATRVATKATLEDIVKGRSAWSMGTSLGTSIKKVESQYSLSGLDLQASEVEEATGPCFALDELRPNSSKPSSVTTGKDSNGVPGPILTAVPIPPQLAPLDNNGTQLPLPSRGPLDSCHRVPSAQLQQRIHSPPLETPDWSARSLERAQGAGNMATQQQATSEALAGERLPITLRPDVQHAQAPPLDAITRTQSECSRRQDREFRSFAGERPAWYHESAAECKEEETGHSTLAWRSSSHRACIEEQPAMLSRSLAEVDEALEYRTRVIEEQLGDLLHNVGALKLFHKSLGPAKLDIMQPNA